MKFDIYGTQNYEKQLNNLISYITQSFSKELALNYLMFLGEQYDTIAQFPYIGRKASVPGIDECRMLVSKKNRIYYEVDSKQKRIYLLYITTSDENYSNLM